MNIKNIFVSRFISAEHPFVIGSIVAVALIAFVVFVARESLRRYGIANELKEINRACPFCNNPKVERRHLKAPMPPDINYPLLSRWDMACQTQARCRNLKCISAGVWYEEKTYARHFSIARRFTHPREFGEYADPNEFIGRKAASLLRGRPHKRHFGKSIFIPPTLSAPPPPPPNHSRPRLPERRHVGQQ